MKPGSFMLIAGEASGDMLGAELALALRAQSLNTRLEPTADVQPLRTGLAPHFFGAGGPRMAATGVELAFDMTQHTVIGLSDVLKNYLKFRRLFRQLFRLALDRQPDVIIGVDYGGFNLRFARAVRRHVRRRIGWFQAWRPKLVQYVSPQVWASRPGRAYQMAEDHDLLLSIFPFEEAWYAKRVPKLRVEFVGHPMVERFQKVESRNPQSDLPPVSPLILLLPGSRRSELQHHLPVMLGALKQIQAKQPALRAIIALPNESLVQQARDSGLPADVEIHIGNLPHALARAEIAIASTGTVTVECACFGVPTVALYKTSWSNYEIARRIVTVKYLAMPNLLADEEIFPEFLQHAATPANIAHAALELLNDDSRRQRIKARLAEVVALLGKPGANARAAEAILSLLE